MTRLESAAWPLAAGSACVFALSVAMSRLPWQAAFVAIALAVVFWAWQSPVLAGAVLGTIAWCCLTGFDVHRLGEIRVTGSGDAVRATVLILAGLLAAGTHAVDDARRRYQRADPVWVDFHATGLESYPTSGEATRRLDAPLRRGEAGDDRPSSAHPIEE
jgi:hypothetical protein